MPGIYVITKVEGDIITLREINSQEDTVNLDIISNTGTEYVKLYDVDSMIWDFGLKLSRNSLKVGDELTLLQKVPDPQE